MTDQALRQTRRRFLGAAALGWAAPVFVPRHVLGSADRAPASERVVAALIGCGGRGGGLLLAEPKVLERGLLHPDQIALLPVQVGEPSEEQGATRRRLRVAFDRRVQ